jgi:uncharacterized protein with von Willebrand factor type A (vWA) domain
MTDAIAMNAALPLEGQMVRFARLLRANGFSVGIAEAADASRALGLVNALDQGQAQNTLRTLFASCEREWRRFDELFDGFWLGQMRFRRTTVKRSSSGSPLAQLSGREEASSKHGTLADIFDWTTSGDDETAVSGSGRSAGASASENLAKADFGRVTDPDELERLHDLAVRLAARMRYRLSRRRKAGRKGERLLLRRTFQRSVSSGGMPLRLYRARRKPKPFNIVIFVDVSGSMDLYSLFFTRFVFALTQSIAKTEAFIFHTRLVRITGTLAQANPMKMMEKLALISQGWSGGTKIGGSLSEFNDRYTSLISPRTLAIIVSDGFDTGPAQKLATELERLRRRVKRVIWLNPLLGRESYEPRAAGMAAALPHLDLFAPAHNLESLAALEEELARL